MNRLWRYSYYEWRPRWWKYLLPGRGTDELGRRTLVIHVPPLGFLAVVYRTCCCPECADIRRQTFEWRKHDEDAG